MKTLVNCAIAFTIVQCMGSLAVLDRTLYGEWEGKGGDKLTQLLNVLSIAAALFLMLRSRVTLARLRTINILPLLYVGLGLVSAAWSTDMGASVRTGINNACVAVAALGMVYSVPVDRIMKITVLVAVMAGLASLALAFTPYGYLSTAIGHTDFRGAFSYKNALAEAMTGGVLAALYCFMAERKGRLKYGVAIVFCIAMTVAAKSSTSLLVGLVYIAMLTVMTLYSRRGAARILCYCLIGCMLIALTVIAIAPDILFEALGKDATLTGRTEIWPYVIPEILKKPLLGWGLNGFWLLSNPDAVEIDRALVWTVPEAHNGLLELLLQLGLVGTILVLVIMYRSFRQAKLCIRYADPYLGRTTIAFLVGLLVMAISEAILLAPGQITTLQFFLCAWMCDASLAVARQKRSIYSAANPALASLYRQRHYRTG
ncbi:MAG TPA: O-antigen ligase family protein [Rhodopila sp.]|uniref:O-antigen ligase family protein n=1 Tax=Rhodopila sp. TaxID=2480087 RepID=UPI002C07F1B1|nr:O-antigen ligase family protein [Rhodopila sp.]HVY16469.1 O-antigen ligase family protein [Rhodopila sp.]